MSGDRESSIVLSKRVDASAERELSPEPEEQESAGGHVHKSQESPEIASESEKRDCVFNLKPDATVANETVPERSDCVVLDVKPGGGAVKLQEPEKRDWVIDLKSGRGSAVTADGLTGEKVCRICHLGSEAQTESSELIHLGCGCRDELGVSHRQCAETWFQHKGNRLCEICGKTARNISVVEDNRVMVVDWNEMRLTASTPSSFTGESSRRCKTTFCNFLLACVVLAFIIPWFFRVNIF